MVKIIEEMKGKIGALLVLTFFFVGCDKKKETDAAIQIHKNQHIVLIGNNLASRMLNFGHFETEMHLRFPDSTLFIRNMAETEIRPDALVIVQKAEIIIRCIRCVCDKRLARFERK